MKRKYAEPDKWKQNEKKVKRNTGQSYETETRNGTKTIPARELKKHRDDCKNQCNQLIDEETRKLILSEFNKLGGGDRGLDKQNLWILSHVTQTEVKRHRADVTNPKNMSRVITMKGHRVCQDFFIKTLGITNGRYQRLMSKVHKNPEVPPEDQRGKGPNTKKIPDDDKERAYNHINSFPKYVSHYSRTHNPNLRYLSPGLNMTKMYNLYTEECQEQNIEPVKIWCYKDIFRRRFNLSFHPPHSDTCNKCDALSITIEYGSPEAMESAQREKDLHLLKAQFAMKVFKEEMKYKENHISMQFDLQKTLPIPRIPSNKVYYSRQLWGYNLGMALNNGKTLMNVWDESEGSRGTREIGSCLVEFVKKIPKNIKSMTLGSDNCGGQTKNSILPKYCFYIIMSENNPVETIDHKFPEVGHTYMIIDERFGIIEKAKDEHIYTLEGWKNLMKKASKSFSVNEMTRDKMVNGDSMDTILTVPTKDTEGQPIGWRKIRWLRYTRDQPYVLQFKHTLNPDAPFRKVYITPFGSYFISFTTFFGLDLIIFLLF